MNRNNKKIALVLVIVILFGFIQPLGIQRAFASDTRYGCSYPDVQTNTVEFIAKADGYDCAYVAGAFSNWQKDDKYKLTWKQDTDGVWKMMSNIPIADFIPSINKTNTPCEYKFILVKAGQADEWMTNDGGNDAANSSFIWTSAAITSAIMDSKDSITAYVSGTPSSTNNFKLYVDGIDVTTGAAVTTGVAATVTVDGNDKKVVFNTSGISIDPTSLIEVKADNVFTQYKKVTLRNALDNYNYDGNDMGATFDSSNISLKLWAPTAYKVEALVYDSYDLTNDAPSRVYPMTLDESNGIHSASIPKVDSAASGAANENKYYMYRLYFKDRDTNGDMVDKITYAVDPYAFGVCANGTKGALVNVNDTSTQPDGWSSDTKPALANPEDSILYEMHIRDFTADPNSGVDADKRGKYLGAVQTGTTYTDGNSNKVKTGIDHLKELGVTHVHLLPAFDFASVDETKSSGDGNRNWGYDPQNYNAPEGSYASDVTNPKTRIKEFRQMVNGFHNNGIRVVMDMVYNHMYDTTNMNNIVPDYYFRSWDDGSLSNASGCGNEIASERPMVRKFIIDSNMHWINDYKIDGLRFDLMAILDKTTMNNLQLEAKSVDPSIIVYGEPWNASSSPLPDDQQTKKNNPGIAAFNDTFRNAIRGTNDLGKGFIDGAAGDPSNSGNVQEGIRGTTSSTFSGPDLTINYADAHDNYCLWDQIEKTQTSVTNGSLRQNVPTDNPLTDWRVDQDILGSGILLTSQGIPFIQEGNEILRTKQGNDNSYNSDDATNEIHWADKAAYKKVFDYYAGLMELRKEHPAFRMTSKSQIQANQQVYTLNNDNELILQQLKNNANGDKWKNILVIYNGSANDKTLSWLPTSSTGTWNIVADNSGINLNSPIGTITQTGNAVNYTIKANSIMVLYDAQVSEQDAISSNLEWDYLFSDQSNDYMSPMEPTENDDVKVRFRARAGQVGSANVHYYDSADSSEHTIAMSKITDSNFYTQKGYDSSKVEFWEGTIPKGSSTKYYNFEVIGNNAETAWISGGAGSNNRGVTSSAPTVNGSGIDHGFSIVPGLSTPQWSKESILYQVMVDRFRDGDPSNNRVAKDPSQSGNPSEVDPWGSEVFSGNETGHTWNTQFFGGDLAGVKQAVPYLKNTLGVTGLYLMPIFQSQSNHKYDTDTYDYVDKNFGGNKGLADLSSSLKTNGMNLVLDGVFNHTSITGPLFTNNHDNNNNSEYYFKGNFTDKNGQQLDYFPWHGEPSLAKLNYGNADLKNYMFDGDNAIAKRYLRAPYNIDGWRLDAADDINTEPRDYKDNFGQGVTDPQQQQNNLNIWQDFNKQVRSVKSDAFILGEHWDNNNQWFYNKAWDGKMNYGGFTLPFVENRNGNQWLGNQSLDNNGNMSVADIGTFTRGYFKNFPYQSVLNSTNSISTHDIPRFLNWNYTGAGNTGMMELAAALQMTYPGIPMIYYGDEIGTVGKGDGSDPYNRGTFDWNVGDWNLKMFNDYKKLIATRKENKDAFVYGAFEEVSSNESNKYIVYSRYGNNNRALVVLNNSGANSTQAITVDRLERYGFKDGDVLTDVMTGNTVTVSNEKAILPSKDMSAAVYVLSSEAPAVSEVTTSTNLSLTGDKDGRAKLSTVQDAKIASYTNGVSLAWDDYTDKDKASDIVVREYDNNNKVIQEVKVDPASETATLPNVTSDDISSGKDTISIKVEANRDLSDSVVNDIYMDSDYVSAGQDRTAPKMVSVTPNDAAGDVDKTSNVVFNFDENIVIADTSKISIVDNAGNAVEFTATASGNQLTVKPNEDLKEGTSYKVTVGAGAITDESNNAIITPITVNFKTKEAQDTTAPEIVTTAPISGSTNIETTSDVVFNFSENIAIADASKISMVDNAGNAVSFTATVSGNQLTVKPNEDLKEGTSYAVTVGAGAITDESNNAITTPIAVNFKTKEAQDTTAPEIVTSAPISGSTNIETTSDVVFNFSENIVIADASKISMLDSAGNAVSFTAIASGNQLTVKPDEDLKEGTSYAVTVAAGAAKDQANNLLAAPTTVNFETKEAQDTTAPEILTTAPISGSTNIETTSDIVFNFNENIAIADASKISMLDNAGNAVAFTATVLGNQLIVNPSTALANGVEYTVIVKAGAIKDESNNLLASEGTMRFTTKQANKQSSSSTSSNSASSSFVTTTLVDKAIQSSSSEDVKIDMTTKDSIIDKGVFKLLTENPTKNLVLEGDNYSWTFAGTDISNNTVLLKDIDTKVSTISPNAEEIKKITLGNPVVNIYFSYHGQLPGKAKVEIKIDPKYDNKTMFMYYYNSDNNRLELVSPNVQVQNGKATFDITHCSDYILSETEIPGAVKQGWNKNSDGTWSFLKADFTNYIGWLNDGGKWYFIQSTGKMQTGWLKSNGLWYYLNESGDMQTGWKQVDGKWYYLSSSGDMQTGWQQVNGIWRYLYNSGEMAKNTVVDGWNLNSNGEGSEIA